MSETVREMIPEADLNARIAELGAQISKDYEGESVYLICILRGAAPFACELAKRITVPVTIDYMTTSSYGAGTVSTGEVRIKSDVEIPVEGRNVLIVEDIIDSGLTLQCLKELLLARKPKSLKLCSLLDKPSRRTVELSADYTGFTIPDEFVVGYGLDYNGHYRQLPYIGVLKPEAYK